MTAQRWTVNRAALTRRAPGLVAVRGPESTTTTTLRGTAVDVWNLLAACECTDEEIAATLAERFDADTRLVTDDIAPLLAELDRAGIIVDASA